jgi:DNA-binding NarL/FixJ family response regulator
MSHSESSQVQVSVLLADDAAIIRTTVKRFLEIEPLINVLGEAVSFRQAISMASTLKPDVVLLDLHMPDDREFDAPFLKSQFLCSGARVPRYLPRVLARSLCWTNPNSMRI